MDSDSSKHEELLDVVRALIELDEHRVELGDRLVELEHHFRRSGCPELSQQALDAFMTRYVGRVLELADGLSQ